MVLAQRVGVERDLMAVATTLPPREAPLAPPPAESAAPRQAEAATAPLAAEKPHSPALAGTPGQEKSVGKVKTTYRRSAGASIGVASRAPLRKKSVARSKATPNLENYAEVFKRCPPPGQSGAVECRRHICNGAESDGPACKPYSGKLR